MSKIEQLLSCVNRVGNLQLLVSAENLEKNNATFEDWIRTRDHSFLNKHLIPQDEHLWSIMMLPQFVAEREKRIMQKLASLQGDPEFGEEAAE